MSMDISYNLINAIFNILDGHVTYSGVTYPVYKSIPKPSAQVYVHIHNVLHVEDGTKDDFVYRGTVQVEIVDESKQRADMTLARKILNVVRGLIKTSKGSTFVITGGNLITFSPGVLNELVEPSYNGILRIRLIDIYEFMIQAVTIGDLLDYDGNIYTTVTIGAQEWIVENLKVTHYSDGTPIPNLTDNAAWHSDTAGAYCSYMNDSAYKSWGLLYNGHACTNASGLAYFTRGGVQEAGWRVPSDPDWFNLYTAVGGPLSGGLMKEAGLAHWDFPNTGATDFYGFKGYGSGNRYCDLTDPLTDGFQSIGVYADFWSASDGFAPDEAFAVWFANNDDIFYNASWHKYCGLNVRCMRDAA